MMSNVVSLTGAKSFTECIKEMMPDGVAFRLKKETNTGIFYLEVSGLYAPGSLDAIQSAAKYATVKYPREKMMAIIIPTEDHDAFIAGWSFGYMSAKDLNFAKREDLSRFASRLYNNTHPDSALFWKDAKLAYGASALVWNDERKRLELVDSDLPEVAR
jgi:hypothetical protein